MSRSFVTLFLGLLISACGLVHCNEKFELDPDWRLKGDSFTETFPDSSPEKAPDTNPEKQPESTPDLPSNCLTASAQQLAFVSKLPEKDYTLLVGKLGTQAASRTIRIQAPAGWLSFPKTVEADAKGEFAFMLNPNKIQSSANARVVVYADAPQAWCYMFTPPIPEDSLGARQIKDPSESSCKVSETKEFTFPLNGKVDSEFFVYSTTPSRASIVSVEYKNTPGNFRLEVKLQCNQAGALSLLFGHEKLQATSFEFNVKSP